MNIDIISHVEMSGSSIIPKENKDVVEFLMEYDSHLSEGRKYPITGDEFMRRRRIEFYKNRRIRRRNFEMFGQHFAQHGVAKLVSNHMLTKTALNLSRKRIAELELRAKYGEHCSDRYYIAWLLSVEKEQNRQIELEYRAAVRALRQNSVAF